MKLFICTNSSNTNNRDAARFVIQRLAERCKAEIFMPSEDSENLFNGSHEYADKSDGCDFVVGIGGDGTVLRAAQYAKKIKKPLIGINNGRLGFLCAAEISDIDRFDESTLYKLPQSQRTMLNFTCGDRQFTALNDVVITKTDMGVSVELEVHYRGEILADWRCDGVIIATPTGSTAYNSSVGGPRLMGDVPCVVISPICPHNSCTRPVVVSDSEPITVKITERTNKKGYIYADGGLCGEIDSTVTIKKSSETLTLLCRDPSWR